MIIIGIDPGYRFTGYGIISYQDDNMSYIESGNLNLTALGPTEKLVYLYSALQNIINLHQPTHGACEQVFYMHNYQSTIKLGKILGIAHCLLGQTMPVAEYATRSIKQALCNRGQASKEEVRQAVISMLKLTLQVSYDESDALAVAIYHAKMIL